MPIILSLLLSSAVLHGQSYTITRKLVAGDADHYSMKMTMDQKLDMMSMGPQNVKSDIEADYVIKVKSVMPGGKLAKVDSHVRTTKMQMGGMMGNQTMPMPMPMPKSIDESGTVDSRNRFLATHAYSPQMSQMMGIGTGDPDQSMGMMIELPDQPVKIGDSWTMKLPGMSMLSATAQTYKVTLVGKGIQNNRPIWNVSIAGTCPVDMDLSKLMGAAANSGSQANPFAGMMKDMKMKMSGTFSVAGKGMIDQRSGKTVSLKYAIGSDITMNIGMPAGAAGGAAVPTSMKMKMAGVSHIDLELMGH